jgi:hypothetical protein
MKLNELLQYVAERGAALVKQDGRLMLQNADKLTERCRAVLLSRRAEIYAHYRIQMPEQELTAIESCPHCGKSLVEKGIDDGEF